MAEIMQVSEQSAAARERRDHLPELIAVGSFLAVTLIGVGLVLIEFRIPDAIEKPAPWVALVAFVLWLRWGAPSSSLTPQRRAQRDERRAGGIVGVMSAGVVLGGVSAATFLTTWSQWLVLGSYVWIAVGVILVLHVRFTIGP